MDLLQVQRQPELVTGGSGSEVISFRSIAKKVEKANVIQAKLHRDQTSLRIIDKSGDYKFYPICKTSGQKLGKYGIGLELYFFFMKMFGILFSLLTLITGFEIYSNYIGEGFRSTYQNQRYTYFTLANQDGVSMYEVDLQKALKDMKVSQKNLEILWPIDISTSILFLLFILMYAWFSHRIVERSETFHLKVSDFSLEVEGFPPFITKEQVLEYFTPYGEVAEVYLSRIYKGKLNGYKKIFEIAYNQELERRENYNSDTEKSNEIADKILNSAGVLNESHDELMVDKVFVIFESIESKTNFIKEHKKEHKKKSNKSNQERRKMNFRLKIKDAPDPSDILWENLEYRNFERMRTRIPILIITAMIIIISFIMVFGIKAYYKSIPTAKSCRDLNISGSLSLDKAKDAYKTHDEISCYCKQMPIDSLIIDSDLTDFCASYIKSFTTSASINTSVSAVIVFVNVLIKIIINSFSKYQRFKYETQRRNYVLTTMTIFMFFNTALTTLLANSNFSFGINAVRGKYDDLTREWYDDVGNTLTVTIIVSIFSPHAFNLVFFYPLSWFKRKLFYRCFKSQYKLNIFFRGPNFDISDSLSQILAVILTSFMYSSGIPFLNFLCSLTLLLTYWANKILLLRYYKTPPVYSFNINSNIIKFMPFAVIFHCAFAIYAYGSSEIFPTHYTKPELSSFVISYHTSFLKRITKKAGIANMIVIGLSFLLIIILKKFDGIFLRKHKKNKVYEITQVPNDNFTKLKIESKFNGITSYSIYENPDYSPLICALDSVAHRKKEIERKSLYKISDHNENEYLPSENDAKGVNIRINVSENEY
ncbi:hypothetical protein SteCoe_6066 [Stentor coeruleus]|uniref:RRM domain-containing protein n=1 Tax=Stentor coeruleus TaxID=5963 RepID=A0A1R2CQV4_9CILI|nr:hypothetical protein SteCoe_6066 [Stentor coeruleus]